MKRVAIMSREVSFSRDTTVSVLIGPTGKLSLVSSCYTDDPCNALEMSIADCHMHVTLVYGGVVDMSGSCRLTCRVIVRLLSLELLS